MYGVEAQATGGGGLAAQAPPDVYFPGVLSQSANEQPQIGGPPRGGVTLPYTDIGSQTPQGLMASSSGAVSNNGQAVRIPVSQQMTNWSSVLDFHNSPAPWILIGILVLYGWLHLSVRANAGRRVGVSAVL